eukprot:scaffold168162_cov16-Tisochrysis_lutea.AAC.1
MSCMADDKAFESSIYFLSLACLQPGEGLTRALKRISGSSAQQTKAMGKRERMRLQQQQQQQQAAQEQTKKPKWQQGVRGQCDSGCSGCVQTGALELPCAPD